MPRFSHDDVIDFQVREAIMLRGLEQRREAEKKHDRADWKRGKPGSGMPG